MAFFWKSLRVEYRHIILCWLCIVLRFLVAESCSSAHGFIACSGGLGITNEVAAREMAVVSSRDCVRQCLRYADCQSVNVQHLSGADSSLNCMQFSSSVNCGDLQPMNGYTNYRRIKNFHSCVEESPGVTAAIHRGNDSFVLMFGDLFQEFQLEGLTLFPTACPEKLSDRFFGLPSDIKAAFARDVVVGSETFYFVAGSDVHQFNGVFPSYFPPWPMSLADFFGTGVPGNIDAVLESENKFYIISGSQVFVSQVLVKNTMGPSATMNGTDAGMSNPMVKWSAITAAAVTAESRMYLLFSGNTYYLYDRKMNSVVDTGRVCSNL